MEQKGTKILISEVTLQGIGMLIGWNAMLSSLDWYNSKFPNNNPGFWLPFLNFLPTLIFQPLSILYGHLWTFNVRIITSYVIVGVILVCTPIIVELTSESLGFIIICVTTVVNGAVNAVSQSGLAGLMGPMPGQYMNALMLGNGLSGLCVSALRLLCLAIFTQNSEGYLHSTELYFAIAGFICVLCIITQLHLMKHPLIIESISKTHCKEAVGKLISPSNEMDSFRNSSGFNTHEKKQVSYAELFKKIWQYLFLIWLNYVITFGVLSHVALATTAK